MRRRHRGCSPLKKKARKNEKCKRSREPSYAARQFVCGYRENCFLRFMCSLLHFLVEVSVCPDGCVSHPIWLKPSCQSVLYFSLPHQHSVFEEWR